MTDPHLFVVFGATGDLFRRKLLPAIHSLVEPANSDVHVVGVATGELDDTKFRELGQAALVGSNLSRQ